MHAAYDETRGGLEVLRYGELPDPEPGPNDVLIRVHASSMDRLDVYTREGSHGQTVRGPRAIGGRDVSGVVEAVGAAVEGLEPGQAVVGSGAATHAELALAPAALTFAIPEGTTFDEAGATPTAGRSAHQALIAKAAGCRVIATAGSAEKCQRALELGADAAIDHYSEDIAERVREWTGGRGVEVVADQVGSPCGGRRPTRWRPRVAS